MDTPLFPDAGVDAFGIEPGDRQASSGSRIGEDFSDNSPPCAQMQPLCYSMVNNHLGYYHDPAAR